jgi:hypothetical protein
MGPIYGAAMSISIPVYAHTIEDITLYTTNNARVVPDAPDFAFLVKLLGYIVAPDSTELWANGNGIDVVVTCISEMGFEHPETRNMELGIAMYYAKRGRHKLEWLPEVTTLVRLR